MSMQLRKLLFLSLTSVGAWLAPTHCASQGQDAPLSLGPNATFAFTNDALPHLYAFGTSSAITYTYAANTTAPSVSNVIDLGPNEQALSISANGRIAILALGDPEHPHLVLFDTATGRRQDIPVSWYDPNDDSPDARLSADGHLLSLYSESGPDETPMTVTVYDWATKTRVATRYSPLLSAGGVFSGGITPDGKIEFDSNRAGTVLVDLKTGTQLANFGPGTVRSPNGVWAVQLPNRDYDESSTDIPLLKNGNTGRTLGKLDTRITGDALYGRTSGVFCDNVSRFVLTGGHAVSVYSIPSGKLLTSFPPSSWQDPTGDPKDPDPTPTVACSPTGTRVAIFSGKRLTFHELK